MSETINAIFAKHSDATAAIESLGGAKFSARQFSVIGSDSDAFREATATLQSGKVDRLLLAMGLIGAIVGCAAGFLGMPNIPSRETMFLVMVPLSACMVGTALGLLTGMLMGAVLKLDNLAPSEAEVRLGTVHQGDMAVSVRANSAREAELIQRIFVEHGATCLTVDLSASEPAIAQQDGPVLVYSRSA